MYHSSPHAEEEDRDWWLDDPETDYEEANKKIWQQRSKEAALVSSAFDQFSEPPCPSLPFPNPSTLGEGPLSLHDMKHSSLREASSWLSHRQEYDQQFSVRADDDAFSHARSAFIIPVSGRNGEKPSQSCPNIPIGLSSLPVNSRRAPDAYSSSGEFMTVFGGKPQSSPLTTAPRSYMAPSFPVASLQPPPLVHFDDPPSAVVGPQSRDPSAASKLNTLPPGRQFLPRRYLACDLETLAEGMDLMSSLAGYFGFPDYATEVKRLVDTVDDPVELRTEREQRYGIRHRSTKLKKNDTAIVWPSPESVLDVVVRAPQLAAEQAPVPLVASALLGPPPPPLYRPPTSGVAVESLQASIDLLNRLPGHAVQASTLQQVVNEFSGAVNDAYSWVFPPARVLQEFARDAGQPQLAEVQAPSVSTSASLALTQPLRLLGAETPSIHEREKVSIAQWVSYTRAAQPLNSHNPIDLGVPQQPSAVVLETSRCADNSHAAADGIPRFSLASGQKPDAHIEIPVSGQTRCEAHELRTVVSSSADGNDDIRRQRALAVLFPAVVTPPPAAAARPDVAAAPELTTTPRVSNAQLVVAAPPTSARDKALRILFGAHSIEPRALSSADITASENGKSQSPVPSPPVCY